MCTESTDGPRVCLVVPCYKESARIGPFLKDLGQSLTEHPYISVRLVDDGSGESETTVLRDLVVKHRHDFPNLEPLRSLPQNSGKGAAIYAGWAESEGVEWLAFADADGSCAAREIVRLASMLKGLPAGVGALFASRIKMLGRKVDRHLHRHLLGRVYATLVSNLLDVDVYDSQCGLKFVRRAAYEAVKDRLTLHRFAFDIDLLTALLDAGFGVKEEPIDWHEVAGGKVRLVRDSLQMFRDVLSVRRKRGAHSAF